MKKSISIILIVLFVTASLFAGWKSGSASIGFGYNLDTSDYGFENGTSVKYNFGFELGSDSKSKSGEGDLRAEIAASFSAKITAKNYTGKTTVASPTVKLYIDKANIIYRDKVIISVLDADTAATFAESYYDDNNDSYADVDVINGFKGTPGFNVTVDGYNVGFGLTGNTEADTFKVLAYASTKEYEVAEGLKAQAAAAVLADQDAATIVAAGKASYEKDKFSAKAALDVEYVEEIALEASATIKYDFVTANVYYYSSDAFESNNLDAKLSVSKTIEDVTVTASADLRDALGDARKVTASVKVNAVLEDFTATAKLDTTFDDSGKITKIAPSASVSSAKLIDGATVSMAWSGADFADGKDKNGKLTAKVEIAF